MMKVYTWAANPARRTVTVADLMAGNGKRSFVQVTANTAEEVGAVPVEAEVIPGPVMAEIPLRSGLITASLGFVDNAG